MSSEWGDRLDDLLAVGSRLEIIAAAVVLAGIVGVGLAEMLGVPHLLLGGAAAVVALVALIAWGRPWRVRTRSPMDEK